MGVLERYEAEVTEDPASVFEACAIARKRFPLVNGLSRCSDVHIAEEFKAVMHRVDGELVPMESVPMPTQKAIDRFVDDIKGANEWVKGHLEEFGATSISYWGEDFGRVRVTVLVTAQKTLQIRLLPDAPPPWEALRLPSGVERLYTNPLGLGIVAGRVSSGKSTLLAAATDSIVRDRAHAVLSVDDTQEYRYQRRKGIVYSVELGQPGQAKSYATALKNSLRSDINTLIVGESRTPDVIDMVLQTANAGPRTMTTMHVRGALSVPDRIIGAFESHAQPQVRQMLAGALQETLYIQLVPSKNPEIGRVPVVEFFFRLDDLQGTILDDKAMTANSVETALKNYVMNHRKDGMCLFEDHLARLVEDGLVDREVALDVALRKDDLRQLLKLGEGSDSRTMVTKSSPGFKL